MGVGLWAEFEWDNNLNQFVSTATDTDSLVGDIQSQVHTHVHVHVHLHVDHRLIYSNDGVSSHCDTLDIFNEYTPIYVHVIT